MNKHYSPVHRGTLTNHLPMYQRSMEKIGFDSDRIEELSQQYVERLGLIDLESPDIQLTELEKVYMSKLPEFRQSIAKIGIDITVRNFLADKKDCISSALFHGMIRLAFAVDSGDQEETARALAYFDTVAQPMLFSDDLVVATEPKESWNNLMAKRMELELDFEGMMTMQRAELILQTPELLGRITQIQVGEETEKKMCFIFANWYMKTRDFYVLHVNTGFQALVALKAYIDDYDDWLKAYWQMAQVFSLFTTERLPIIRIEVKPWEEVVEEAKAMTDAHDVKLFYACKDMYERYPLKVLNKVAHVTSHKYWGHH